MSLQNKTDDLDHIADLADILRPEDGMKPNGTTDIDSR